MDIITDLNSRTRKRRIIFVIMISVVTLVCGILCLRLINALFQPNVKTHYGNSVSLLIPTGSSFQTVKDSLYSKDIIVSGNTFEFVSRLMNYDNHVKPGHYVIKDRMTNRQLVGMLRSGSQSPVNVIFNNIRTVEQLAGIISLQIEADSLSILNELVGDSALTSRGFNRYNFASLFLPNTYEFYWNTDAKGFIKRMKKEYLKFWDTTRLKKTESIGLTPLQVSTLASIVDKETTKVSEMPTIAGVYINRLKKKIALQADPTLVFALGDYDIHRVLDVHKQIESPYNTYKYAGLPPGPICIPSIAAIDAVLNAENHKYFYFCAKDDMSGCHVFAKSLDEHNRNADKYRRALNKNRIYK